MKERYHRDYGAVGHSANGVILIRPDGFVGWRTAHIPTSPEQLIDEVLRHILCRVVRIDREEALDLQRQVLPATCRMRKDDHIGLRGRREMADRIGAKLGCEVAWGTHRSRDY